MQSDIMRSEMSRPSGGTVSGNGMTSRDAYLRELADGALRRAARSERLDLDLGVHELIRQACAVARECGIPAERLLLVLKDSWWELPEARHLARPDAGDVLSRAITVCIKEYYARGDPRQ